MLAKKWSETGLGGAEPGATPNRRSNHTPKGEPGPARVVGRSWGSLFCLMSTGPSQLAKKWSERVLSSSAGAGVADNRLVHSPSLLLAELLTRPIAESVFYDITVSSTEITELERSMREQYQYKLWHIQRMGRLRVRARTNTN